MNISTGSSYWTVAQLKPNHERVAAQQLSMQGVTSFLPIYQVTRKWSDRVKKLELPLFPGYLFCRYEQPLRRKILKTLGVTRLLGSGVEPEPVSDDEVTAIQRIVASGLPCRPLGDAHQGDRVRICDGPLRDLEGVVMRGNDQRNHLVVSVALLQRSVSVHVPAHWLAPVRNPVPFR